MFENYEQRIDGINKVLKKYDISSLEEAKRFVMMQVLMFITW